MKMHLKMLSAKRRPFCPGKDETYPHIYSYVPITQDKRGDGQGRNHITMDWVIIDSANGLPPVRHQAITWTNADSLSIGPLETNCSKISNELHFFLISKKCI